MQHPEVVVACLRESGVYLVMCHVRIKSEVSVHAIAIDTVRGELSDSLKAQVQNFDVDTLWKDNPEILNVIHVYQIMTQAQE